MHYFIIAGEASGDLHGGHLMQGLKQADADARFTFCGGGRMQEISEQKPLIHYKEMAVMGLIEVMMNLRRISGFFRTCQHRMQQDVPDVLILIDYPGFNLRMAAFAHKMGIPVHYYISPKIWAWKQARIHKIKRYVNRMFVIFPFEVDFYRKHNFEVEYHGNPLFDEIACQKRNIRRRKEFVESNGLNNKPIVAVLAGSRRQEIKYNLPVMLNLVHDFPGKQFVVAGAPSLMQADYAPYMKQRGAGLVFNQTYELLHHAQAALVTSGTATLEAALLDTPQVICYRMAGGKLATAVKRMLGIGFIGLVNIILQREAVKELIQEDMNPQNLKTELQPLTEDTPELRRMMRDYSELKSKLGNAGASQKVALRMVQLLKNNG